MFLDRVGLDLAHALRGPVTDVFFAAVTWFGSLMVLAPAATLFAAWLWRRGRRGEARFLALALASAPVLGFLIKQAVGRPRPTLYPALADVASPLSFPSVHAMQVTAAALAVYVVAGWRPRALLPLGALVLLVAFSRVHLQVHYPSDVLAGVLFAALWIWGLRARLQITM